ncbi:hypothetical protein [Spiroplasma ixodetis]|uniref:hypothetical protein n=1 Tax=Spiroplasma ixodetis TaxID=2141 RepID=UPI003D7D8670
MYKIFEICHSNNIENLILLSDPTNATVGEFYEKLGFTYAWNKKTFFYDYEINIPHAIFNKRDDIKKWKNIKIKEIFIDFDKSKSKAINDEQKILKDSEILSSILDKVLIHEESILKEDYQKVIDWFNQQREQIIKNPKQWWNTLTPKQVDVVKNEAKKWWNNLTPEQRKIKLLEKQAYQKKTIKKDDTPLLCDFDQNIKNKLDCMQSMKTSTPVFKKIILIFRFFLFSNVLFFKINNVK